MYSNHFYHVQCTLLQWCVFQSLPPCAVHTVTVVCIPITSTMCSAPCYSGVYSNHFHHVQCTLLQWCVFQSLPPCYSGVYSNHFHHVQCTLLVQSLPPCAVTVECIPITCTMCSALCYSGVYSITSTMCSALCYSGVYSNHFHHVQCTLLQWCVFQSLPPCAVHSVTVVCIPITSTMCSAPCYSGVYSNHFHHVQCTLLQWCVFNHFHHVQCTLFSGTLPPCAVHSVTVVCIPITCAVHHSGVYSITSTKCSALCYSGVYSNHFHHVQCTLLQWLQWCVFQSLPPSAVHSVTVECIPITSTMCSAPCYSGVYSNHFHHVQCTLLQWSVFQSLPPCAVHPVTVVCIPITSTMCSARCYSGVYSNHFHHVQCTLLQWCVFQSLPPCAVHPVTVVCIPVTSTMCSAPCYSGVYSITFTMCSAPCYSGVYSITSTMCSAKSV